MAKKKERKKTYKFIEKLIDKVTTSKSNNTEFVCYGHLVELLSGTEDYVSVTIYNTDDRYGGGMADSGCSILPGASVSLTMNSNTRTRIPRMSMTKRTNTPRLSSI